MIPTPGAAMSGLTRSAPVPSAGPRDEKPAICGRGVGLEPVVLPTAKDAVGVAVDATYALMAAPATSSTWTVGTEWTSGSRLLGLTFVRIIPTPPARLTSADFATRS